MFVKECLESIENQSYNNMQLIIVDDASTDNSQQLIQNWIINQKIKIHCIFNEKNKGLSKSLNNCFDLIKGRYTKFISADDLLDQNYLKKTVNFLSINSSRNFGMVCTHTWAIDENSLIIDDIADYNLLLMHSKEELRDLLLKGNRIAALTVLMRTDVLFDTGRYDEELILEDYDRWLRINEKYWIGYIPEKLSYYRIHGANISTINQNRIDEEILFLKIKYDKKCLNHEMINYEIRNFFLDGKLSEKLKKIYFMYPKRNKLTTIFIKLNLKYILSKF